MYSKSLFLSAAAVVLCSCSTNTMTLYQQVETPRLTAYQTDIEHGQNYVYRPVKSTLTGGDTKAVTITAKPQQ